MRRRLAALAPLLLAACAGAPPAGRSTDAWADAPLLGPLQVALLFHQLDSTPAPPELALAWPELCHLHGAEAQAAAARDAAPRLAAEADRAGRTRTWRVQVRQPLGPYDLPAGGYHTTLRDGAVIRFDAFNYCFRDLRYLLAFGNGGAHALVLLDEEAARAMLRRDPTRTLTLDLLVEPEAAQPDARALVVRIRRLRASDATGAVLFDGPGR